MTDDLAAQIQTGLSEPLFEGDAINKRSDYETAEEDCQCCNNGHPNDEAWDASGFEQDVCFDCNFSNCQKPLYWMRKMQAHLDRDRKMKAELPALKKWVENRIAGWQAIEEEDDVDMLKEVMAVPPTSVEIAHAQADTAILELREILRRIDKAKPEEGQARLT